MSFFTITRRILSYLVVIHLFTFAAAAQSRETNQCEFKPLILDLANRIIDLRPTLQGFQPKSFGSNATYFIIRYGDLTTAEGFALIKRVKSAVESQPRNFSDLQVSYAISRLGVGEGLAHVGEGSLGVFAPFPRWSTTRAIILSDGGQSFFEFLRDDKAGLDSPSLTDYIRIARYSAAFSIMDQSDSFKLEFARLAEENDEYIIAAVVLANRSNLDAFYAFLNRYSENELVQMAINDPWGTIRNMLMLSGEYPLKLNLGLKEVKSTLDRTYLDIIAKADFASNSPLSLNAALNQTGLINEVAAVARNYLTALEAGRILPADDAEASALYIYKSLLDNVGNSEVIMNSSLNSKFRHFSGTVHETMGWIIAKSALAPFVRHETDMLPGRPTDLPDDFAWQAWLDLADATRDWQDLISEPLSQADILIAVELLYLRGAYDLAIELIAESSLSPKTTATVYHDFMMRFDLRCAPNADFPGNTIVMAWQPLFKFPLAVE